MRNETMTTFPDGEAIHGGGSGRISTDHVIGDGGTGCIGDGGSAFVGDGGGGCMETWGGN
jgi:hypothetical protein